MVRRIAFIASILLILLTSCNSPDRHKEYGELHYHGVMESIDDVTALYSRERVPIVIIDNHMYTPGTPCLRDWILRTYRSESSTALYGDQQGESETSLSSTFRFYGLDLSDLQFDASSSGRMYGLQFDFNAYGSSESDGLHGNASSTRYHDTSLSDSGTGSQTGESMQGIDLQITSYGTGLSESLYGLDEFGSDTALQLSGRMYGFDSTPLMVGTAESTVQKHYGHDSTSPLLDLNSMERSQGVDQLGTSTGAQESNSSYDLQSIGRFYGSHLSSSDTGQDWMDPLFGNMLHNRYYGLDSSTYGMTGSEEDLRRYAHDESSFLCSATDETLGFTLYHVPRQVSVKVYMGVELVDVENFTIKFE